MATWKQHGLRGSVLEDRINHTISDLRHDGLALIQKVPTPITPVRLDGKGHITLAYFDQKSTVDYIGVIQGVPVCFDAKECKEDTFPLKNIHEHQLVFMQDFTDQDGIAFFLLYYSKREEYYYLTFDEAAFFWNRMKQGGRKSFRYDELNPNHFIKEDHLGRIRFLDAFAKDVESEKQKKEKLIC